VPLNYARRGIFVFGCGWWGGVGLVCGGGGGGGRPGGSQAATGYQ
jgi:hypothetical protein